MGTRNGVGEVNVLLKHLDEFIVCFRDNESNRKVMTDITQRAIDKVSKQFHLRRELGCDVQMGKDYSEIH